MVYQRRRRQDKQRLPLPAVRNFPRRNRFSSLFVETIRLSQASSSPCIILRKGPLERIVKKEKKGKKKKEKTRTWGECHSKNATSSRMQLSGKGNDGFPGGLLSFFFSFFLFCFIPFYHRMISQSV